MSILKDFKIWSEFWTLCTKCPETWVSKMIWTEKQLSFLSKFWKTCISWVLTLWKKLRAVQMNNSDSQNLPIKPLFKNTLTPFSDLVMINTSQNQFFISFLTMQSIKEKRPNNSSLWVTFLKLSVKLITIHKLSSTDVSSKSVSILSTSANILKYNNSFLKSVQLVKTETKPKISSVNIWPKDLLKVSKKNKFQETKFFLIIFILMSSLLNHLNLSLLWFSKFHTLWLKVEKLLPRLSEKFISNMKDQ